MAWELIYRGHDGQQVTLHDSRSDAITQLTHHLIDAGVTVADDPGAEHRNTAAGGFSAQFDAPDGTQIAYSLRQMKDIARYLNLAQFEERIGMARGGLSKFRLPEPDVIVGPVNEDGSTPRGTARGWTEQTIDEWNDARPGRGTRSDLTTSPTR